MAKFDTETFYRASITHLRPDGKPRYTEHRGPYVRHGDAKSQVTKARNHARRWNTGGGVEAKIEKLTGTWEAVE